MTSKEFNRRREYYRSLSYAASIFSNPTHVVNFIYKATCIDSLSRKYEMFCSKPELCFFGESVYFSCKSLYFVRFSLTEFLIQRKYFLSFYNRCSQYQKSVIDSDKSLEDLINFNDNSK